MALRMQDITTAAQDPDDNCVHACGQQQLLLCCTNRACSTTGTAWLQ